MYGNISIVQFDYKFEYSLDEIIKNCLKFVNVLIYYKGLYRQD